MDEFFDKNGNLLDFFNIKKFIAKQIHFDLAYKSGIKVEKMIKEGINGDEIRKDKEITDIWNAMDIIENEYLKK